MPPDLVVKCPIMRRSLEIIRFHRSEPLPFQGKPLDHSCLRTKAGQHPPLAIDILNPHAETAAIQKSTGLELARRRSPIQRKLPNIRKPAQSKRQRVMIWMSTFIGMRVDPIGAIRQHRLTNRRHIPRRLLIRNLERLPSRRIHAARFNRAQHLRPPRRPIIRYGRVTGLRRVARMQWSRVCGMQNRNIRAIQNKEATQSLVIRMSHRNQDPHSPILLHSSP